MRNAYLTVILFVAITTGFPYILSAQTEVTISINTDQNPEGIGWNLYDIDNNLLASDDGELTLPNTLYTREMTLPEGTCMRFIITDDMGNGFDAPGYYLVYIDEEIVASGGPFDDLAEHIINCHPGYTCEGARPLTETGFYFSPPIENYWYTFTPSTTGLYQISTCFYLFEIGAYPDTELWIYDSCNTITNGPEGAISYNEENSICEPSSGFLYFELLGGTQYFFRIKLNETALSEDVGFNLFRYEELPGCTDPLACNYDYRATSDDNSCIYNTCAPDLSIRQTELVNSITLDSINNINDCYIEENCLKGLGMRDIVRFDTWIDNLGNADYIVGYPEANSGGFSNDNCHGHWHQLGYAEYLLYAGSGQPEPIGFKNGFCVIDLECSDVTPRYSCQYMGISAGCSDIYNSDIDCQWIDVTDIPDGQYTLVARINWAKAPDLRGMAESDYSNNWAQACIVLDRSSGDLELDVLTDCAAYTDCFGTEFGNAILDCEGVCGGLAHYGDISGDQAVGTIDIDYYLDGILDGGITPTTCNDLNANGTVSVYDATLLRQCLLDNNNDESDLYHTHCVLPGGINNDLQSATLRLATANHTEGYIDVEYLVPDTEILAYQFNISNLPITQIEDLTLTPNLYLDTRNGTILAMANEANPINSTANYLPLVRLYFDTVWGEVCISDIQDIVNQNNEKINSVADMECQEIFVSNENTYTTPSAVQCYPNPTNDFLHIQNTAQSTYQLQLISMEGKIIRTFEVIQNSEFRMNIRHLPTGIYFIHAVNSESAFSQKIIIE